jgi:hypothetical protein
MLQPFKLNEASCLGRAIDEEIFTEFIDLRELVNQARVATTRKLKLLGTGPGLDACPTTPQG